MRRKHRSPVVALGALCLVACLSLLPATSGAYMVRWGDTGDTLPGDPDEPTGGSVVIDLPFFQLRITVVSTFVPGRGVLLVPTIARLTNKTAREPR